MTGVTVRAMTPADVGAVTRMSAALWPENSPRDHTRHVRALAAGRPLSTLPLAILVAERRIDGRVSGLIGFIEVGFRSHANGCDGRRAVGFIEGWWVEKAYRRKGVGAQLVEAAERWARRKGAREMASDTWADHRLSVRAHHALGYRTEGKFYNFVKKLT